jgi:hypothetical protein
MTYKCRGNGKVIPVYRSKAQAGKVDERNPGKSRGRSLVEVCPTQS